MASLQWKFAAVLAVLALVNSAAGVKILESLTTVSDPPPFVIEGNALRVPIDPINPPFDNDTDSKLIIDVQAKLDTIGMIKSWRAAGEFSSGSGLITFVVFRKASFGKHVYNIVCHNTFIWDSGQNIFGFQPGTFKQFHVPLNDQCFGQANDVIGLRTWGEFNVNIYKENTKDLNYKMGWLFDIDLDTTTTVNFGGTEPGSILSRQSILVYSYQGVHYQGTEPEYTCDGLRDPAACNGTSGSCVAPDVCECEDGWEGYRCGEDKDGCEEQTSPCFPGVDCVDVPAPGVGNTCGDCPPGLEGNGTLCFEEDGCDPPPCFVNVECLDKPSPQIGFDCGDCPPEFPIGDGINCTRYECFGESNQSVVCSGNGLCIAPDECECDLGYAGEECQTFTGYECPNIPDVSNTSFCSAECARALPCYFCCQVSFYNDPGTHQECRQNCVNRFSPPSDENDACLAEDQCTCAAVQDLAELIIVNPNV